MELAAVEEEVRMDFSPTPVRLVLGSGLRKARLIYK